MQIRYRCETSFKSGPVLYRVDIFGGYDHLDGEGTTGCFLFCYGSSIRHILLTLPLGVIGRCPLIVALPR